jgi:general secretion pathway protein N
VRRIIYTSFLIAACSFELHADDQLVNSKSAFPSLRLESLSATRDRPLFSQSRRRTTVEQALPAANVGTAQPAGPRFSLTGIILADAQAVVLLRDNTTSELRTVRPGDSVGIWHVLVDSNYQVRLKNGADEIKLEMFAPD